MFGALAIVGALTVAPALNRTAPTAQKQSALAAKQQQPQQRKASAPSPRERAVPIPQPRAPKAIVAPEKKRAAVKRKPGLPSCAAVQREYDRMSGAQRMAAYMRATPEQVAHGRRCLGM